MNHFACLRRLVLSTVALVGLYGCGGGGGSSDGTAVPGGEVEPLLSRCSGGAGPLRIMPLGDSITESRSGYSSYRYELSERLKTLGCSFDFVGSRRGVSRGARDQGAVEPKNPNFDQDHEGHWDYRADEVATRVTSWAAQAQPDVVLLHVGSNDIFQGQSPANAFSDISSIVSSLRGVNPDVVIFVAQVIPARQRTSQIRELNGMIASLAAESSPPIVVVDLASGFDPQRHTFDGVHPNESGERIMADGWANALAAG